MPTLQRIFLLPFDSSTNACSLTADLKLAAQLPDDAGLAFYSLHEDPNVSMSCSYVVGKLRQGHSILAPDSSSDADAVVLFSVRLPQLEEPSTPSPDAGTALAQGGTS